MPLFCLFVVYGERIVGCSEPIIRAERPSAFVHSMRPVIEMGPKKWRDGVSINTDLNKDILL